MLKELKKLFNREKRKSCAAVIVAAGSGERMGRDKIMLDLGGKPVIARTIAPFQESEYIDEIIVVTKSENTVPVSEICNSFGFSKVKSVIEGGATRTESALAGVSAVSSKIELIAIHDGARPFVSDELIKSVVTCASVSMAAVPAVKSIDTVRVVDENGVVIYSPDRDYIVNIQTPQVFDTDIIKGALSYAVSKNISLTDDSSAAEKMGVKIHTVEGDRENFKLTVPDDFTKAAAVLKSRGE